MRTRCFKIFFTVQSLRRCGQIVLSIQRKRNFYDLDPFWLLFHKPKWHFLSFSSALSLLANQIHLRNKCCFLLGVTFYLIERCLFFLIISTRAAYLSGPFVFFCHCSIFLKCSSSTNGELFISTFRILRSKNLLDLIVKFPVPANFLSQMLSNHFHRYRNESHLSPWWSIIWMKCCHSVLPIPKYYRWESSTQISLCATSWIWKLFPISFYSE